MYSRRRGEVNIPENSAQSEGILLLKPASVAPAMYPHGQQIVLAVRGQEGGEVEGRRVVHILAVADLVPIDIKVHGRLDPFEGDVDLFAVFQPVGIHIEGFSVKSDRVGDRRGDGSRIFHVPAALVSVLSGPGVLRVGIGGEVKAL